MATPKKSSETNKQITQSKAPQPEAPERERFNQQANAAAIIQRTFAASRSRLPNPADTLTLQRTVGNRIVNRLLNTRSPSHERSPRLTRAEPRGVIQRAKTSYATSAESEISGTQLLELIALATRVVLPELSGKKHSDEGFTGQRSPGLTAHAKEWGELIKKKQQPAFIGAREPEAPNIGKTSTGFDVNAGFWLSQGNEAAPSYPVIAKYIESQNISTEAIRNFMETKKGGNASTALIGEATFGAEPARNPRAFATALMMFDLLESGGVPIEQPEGKVSTVSELYNIPHTESGTTMGALPMMGASSYEEGKAGIPKDDKDLKSAEQRKEAIAISAWLSHLQEKNGKPFTRDEIVALFVERLSSFQSMAKGYTRDLSNAKGLEDYLTLIASQADIKENEEEDQQRHESEVRQVDVSIKQAEDNLNRLKVRQPKPGQEEQFEAAVKSAQMMLDRYRREKEDILDKVRNREKGEKRKPEDGQVKVAKEVAEPRAEKPTGKEKEIAEEQRKKLKEEAPLPTPQSGNANPVPTWVIPIVQPSALPKSYGDLDKMSQVILGTVIYTRNKQWWTPDQGGRPLNSDALWDKIKEAQKQ